MHQLDVLLSVFIVAALQGFTDAGMKRVLFSFKLFNGATSGIA